MARTSSTTVVGMAHSLSIRQPSSPAHKPSWSCSRRVRSRKSCRALSRVCSGGSSDSASMWPRKDSTTWVTMTPISGMFRRWPSRTHSWLAMALASHQRSKMACRRGSRGRSASLTMNCRHKARTVFKPSTEIALSTLSTGRLLP